MVVKKWLRRIGTVMGGLILLVAIAIVLILWLDSRHTSYLRIRDTNNSFVLTNVNIVPMTADTVLYGQRILVKNGEIMEIAPTIDGGPYKRIDGKGRFVTPGLADMHVHIWDDYELGLYLSKGVTTVRNMWGMPFHLRMKERISNNDIYAPLFFTASPKLTGPDDGGIDKKQVKDAQDARSLVVRYKEQGYDYIKTYAGLPQAIFDAIKDEATAQHITLASHPSFEVPYDYHFSKPIKSLEHTEDIVQQVLDFKQDSILLQSTIDAYVLNKMAHTPTLTVFHKIVEIIKKDSLLLKQHGIGYMNPAFLEFGAKDDYNRWTSTKLYEPEVGNRIKKQHQHHLQIVKQMNDAGVTLIAGTDSGISYAIPGFGIHEELGFYIDAGLSNYEALRTATVNPSKVYKELAETGTLENGKLANMILVKDNPLENLETLETPEAVFIKGHPLDTKTLTQFQTKAFRRGNYWSTLVRLGEGLLFQ
ncbi:amidohydrolase family protein [Zobellia roscoffensis]|uniref:amidohydrolase family protein n=1 Tax=Zobellia roscoffensis TaxID=2779508 RepID=UPI00188A8B04|nr:amidohydrolase family protein [Zobellia roscoffensis]